ncbi:MAG: heavy metal-associated domain-containing protein, partial [Deltaproteobacteria bacterium]
MTSTDNNIADMAKSAVDVKRNELSAEMTFAVRGLHCASCVNRLESRLQEDQGISTAIVNLATETGFVRFDPRLTSTSDIFAAVHAAGYTPVELYEAEAEGVKDLNRQRNWFIF